MIAIKTTYVGPSATKPARIVASTSNGHRLCVSRWAVDADRIEDSHQKVAEMLCEKMGWTHKLSPPGGIKDGYVFVFLD